MHTQVHWEHLCRELSTEGFLRFWCWWTHEKRKEQERRHDKELKQLLGRHEVECHQLDRNVNY